MSVLLGYSMRALKFSADWLNFFFVLFFLFRTALAAYGGSQARGLIRAGAAGLQHSHSNAESELHL